MTGMSTPSGEDVVAAAEGELVAARDHLAALRRRGGDGNAIATAEWRAHLAQRALTRALAEGVSDAPPRDAA